MATPTAQHVVIIGGGFGGLYAAQALKRTPVDITLIDRRNFHLFQPLLYQVATGALSPGDIASPLRAVLKRQARTRVLLAEVVDIDVANRCVQLRDEDEMVRYDTLIVAAGASHHYFGNEQWAAHAPGLKTIEDAIGIRHRILLAFEAAEREPDLAQRRAWLTFAIIGAGPTGVELAGALAEIARHTLKRDFRTINPADAQIMLIEHVERVLPPYPPVLSAKAAAVLERIGVQVRTRTRVTAIDADGIEVESESRRERIATRTVLWAAGVQASPLGRLLADRAAAQLDRVGRVIVQPDCTVANHPEIFVIGDLAHHALGGDPPLPGVAPVAMQQGRYVANLIAARLRGDTFSAFRYADRGSMAVIGRAAAVASIAGLQFNGALAWFTWLFVHLMYLVEFDNRLLVLVQWAWNYLTWNRGARLITGEGPAPREVLPPPKPHE
ncbi:MAG: NAD(P)/FAD-dependent oxidoreductase [Deltaproteobacteria bacterium]|nr:NAD(P)/FAD-dependent oxidoreductase [Deltaproteobacteria bacterium]MBI3386582.1 NAD(P)/FAD-dependent oxidoreductase [Deltaproteobacteria bacterium]